MKDTQDWGQAPYGVRRLSSLFCDPSLETDPLIPNCVHESRPPVQPIGMRDEHASKQVKGFKSTHANLALVCSPRVSHPLTRSSFLFPLSGHKTVFTICVLPESFWT